LPSSWQGWAVLAAFVILLAAGFVIFPPANAVVPFLAYVGLLITVLVAICWLKGEPPHWRWGK